MIILDSNILIYSFQPTYAYLRSLIFNRDSFSAISAITILETIGFANISFDEKQYYQIATNRLRIFNLNRKIIDCAVELKQQRKMSVGDSLIAATALTYNFTLYTRNIDDFKHIEGLDTINPIKLN